jgi:hypothetical protein
LKPNLAQRVIMKAKLNLTIDENLLGKIKRYAASRKTSVSELVEAYFRSLTSASKKRNIVEMMDAMKKPAIDLPEDLKTAYFEEQKEKYGP